MRRSLSLCLLATVLAYLAACGESPTRPSVVTDRPVNPPKTSARYILVPWDISLFFNLPGGAVVAGALTAATPGAAAEGDNLTGTFANSNGFGGTLSGVLTGALEGGTFSGILTTVTPSGCIAERRFSGPVGNASLNWSPGDHLNDCGGTSPLTGPIQATLAPTQTQPPCTYSAAIDTTGFAAGGGNGTVNVTTGSDCTWFANSTASFVTPSALQGTGDGSVNFTVAPNTTITARTATLVIAGRSFTITQAAAACVFSLSESGRTFEPEGGNSAIEMRTLAGCGWQASSDVPWLIVRNTSGTGTGLISFAVEANSGPSQRAGTITAAGQRFTVTQNPLTCSYTVTPPVTTAFTSAGGTGSATVATQAACAWAATSSVPWVTISPPAGGTGNGSVTFTVAPNTEAAARTGVLNVAGREITLTQAPAACVYTLTPSTTAIPAGGGAATIGVATQSACTWTAAIAPDAPWITVTTGGSGAGNGTVSLAFAANTTGGPRQGTVTIAGQSVTFTQAANVGSLTGLITNSVNGQPIQGATVVARTETGAPMAVPSDAAGRYTFSSVPPGSYTVDVTRQGFDAARGSVGVNAGQATTFNVTLVARPVTLEITWTPNPTSVDPQQPICDSSENYCWRSTVTVQETSGNAATVTSWLVRFYFPDGSPDTAATQTRTAAEFAEQFGVNPIAGLATLSSARVVTQSDSRGGAVDYVFSGTDPYGRAFSVTSPRLVLNPVVFSGTLSVAPGAPGRRRADDRPAARPSGTSSRRP